MKHTLKIGDKATLRKAFTESEVESGRPLECCQIEYFVITTGSLLGELKGKTNHFLEL